MDTLLTFENSFDAYMNHYVSNSWQPADPRKIWHIIYDVPQQQIANVTALASQRGAGLLEITSGIQPNPYNILSNDTYIKACMDAVAGGQPAVAATAVPYGGIVGISAPEGLRTKAVDYTSVTINWSLVSNATAYAVYLDGVKTLDLPSTSQVTVGMLTPGTSHDLTVKAISESLVESLDSNAVTVATPALPNGRSVVNVNATVTFNLSIFSADVLVPYAFVRLYIQAQDGAIGWPINYTPTNYIMVNYMIEGTTLFMYSGTAPGMTWSWVPIDQAAITIAGYHYTWQVPMGTSKADTSKFIVQTQGYDPAVNVFVPCPVAGGLDGNGRYCG
ncbi:hypothetical protein AMS68_002197 [Peltaster fructicola]|uniref:Fibronectin type-III domain-containing protein n=1 Tax=Peltaster fructicola TaxID=286661 RepID=A0A6H0XQC6_9PEZI|nr:hypothetical protein AMS68_002197 [Peltaster fructicola]